MAYVMMIRSRFAHCELQPLLDGVSLQALVLSPRGRHGASTWLPDAAFKSIWLHLATLWKVKCEGGMIQAELFLTVLARLPSGEFSLLL